MQHYIFFILFTLFPIFLDALIVNDLSFSAAMTPGESRQVKLSLINESAQPEVVSFRLCDYTCNSNGEHAFDEPGNTQGRSNASWIRLNSDTLTLAPGQKEEFFYVIDAPQDSSLDGSYWSVLLIEPSTPVSKLRNEVEGFHIDVKVRYAHHIVTTVGAGTPKLKVVDKEFKTIDGQQKLCVHVENTGTLFLEPKLTLKLYNSEGKVDKTLEGGKERLYPGCSQCYYLDAQEVDPQAKLKGFLLLDAGGRNLFGEAF